MANNLKALKTRIKTVSSTEKVTQAMKMITTSKFAQSNSRLNKLRDYFEVNNDVLNMMFKAFALETDLDTLLAKKIYGALDGNTLLLIAISSDKGLCGAYNHNVNKALEAEVAKCKELGKGYKIIAIGKRAREYTKNNYFDNMVDVPALNLDIKTVNSAFIAKFKHILKEELLKEDVVEAKVVYTKYVSSFVQDVSVKDIVPFSVEETSPTNEQESSEFKLKVETDIKATSNLDRVFDDYLDHIFYSSLLHSLNSEYAVRMMTMDNASTNAQDLIKKLTLEVNRTRQAAVTSELVEIISGAEAV